MKKKYQNRNKNDNNNKNNIEKYVVPENVNIRKHIVVFEYYVGICYPHYLINTENIYIYLNHEF